MNRGRNSEIVIMTVPLREKFDRFTPLGAMAIIQSLKDEGYEPLFYDIDTLRPEKEQIRDFFLAKKPDIVGISAVTSTGYSVVRDMCLLIREILPEVKIVIGGNLCASAELLINFCGVDICVLSEGELIIKEVVAYFDRNIETKSEDELRSIKGIVYKNSDNEIINTGYGKRPSSEQIKDNDYSILEKHSNIDAFITEPSYYFLQDERSLKPEFKDKKEAYVFTSKGCVNRCTFCHRWIHGYRQFSSEKVLKEIEYLQDNYNVGFVRFVDECFGVGNKVSEELIDKLKNKNILWQAQGVRADCVTLAILKKWKEAGCVGVNYGMESGSPDMLTIMEKNVRADENYKAAEWTAEAGLYSICQLVIGMPGETNKTIRETRKFLLKFTDLMKQKDASVNFVQALPGTPVYEYGRYKGIIGNTSEEEAAYLNFMSDVNAADPEHLVNFTDSPYFRVRSWQIHLKLAVRNQYCFDLELEDKICNLQAIFFIIYLHAGRTVTRKLKNIYKKISGSTSESLNRITETADIGRNRMLYSLRIYLVFLILVKESLKKRGLLKTSGRLSEYITKPLLRLRAGRLKVESLRKTVEGMMEVPDDVSGKSLLPLRKGR